MAASKPRKITLRANPSDPSIFLDPAKYSQYIFGHTGLILDELLQSISEISSPTERTKALQPLLDTVLTYRPFVAVQAATVAPEASARQELRNKLLSTAKALEEDKT